MLVVFLFLPIWLVVVFVVDFDSNKIAGFVENPAFIIIFVLFYLIVFVASIFLQIISRSSGILGIYRASSGIAPITFVDLIKDSFQYFWHILGVSALLYLVVLAFFLVFFACTAGLSMVTMGFATICIQPLFILMIPLSLLMMAVVEQAEAAVIVDRLSVMDSIRRGYELVRANLGTYTLITLVIYFGMNILVSIVIVPFMIPFMFFMFTNMEAGMDFGNIIRIQAVFMVVLLPVMAFVQGVGLTYLRSALMVIYLRLTNPQNNAPAILEENA